MNGIVGLILSRLFKVEKNKEGQSENEPQDDFSESPFIISAWFFVFLNFYLISVISFTFLNSYFDLCSINHYREFGVHCNIGFNWYENNFYRFFNNFFGENFITWVILSAFIGFLPEIIFIYLYYITLKIVNEQTNLHTENKTYSYLNASLILFPLLFILTSLIVINF